MSGNGITILGLGPGNPDLLTRQAWQVLENSEEIYLRTSHHLVVKELPPNLSLHSFDELYDTAASFEELYETIVAKVLDLGRRSQGVIYAVPGHPMIAEATTPEIVRRSHLEQIPLRIVEGLSFLEPCFSALELDPFPHTSIVDALELSLSHVPPFPPNVPALIAQIHSRAVASDVKLNLMSLYPDEHPVALIHAAGTPEQLVERLPLYEIDRSEHIGLLTALYLPPLDEGSSFEAFLEVVAHLRAPNGCPWDREQTHQSLRSDLLEETYEALAALDSADPESMREEFGDLILLILLQAQIASDYGEFTIADVLRGIHTKIIRRHPHVFGEVELKDNQAVLQNWEKLKAEERKENGKETNSLLDGVVSALPALVRAQIYQKRAARMGFDWPNVNGVLAKVDEEIAEVQTASDDDERASEIGDLLFAVVNLARWFNIDAESALRSANDRFYRRFSYIESTARDHGRSVADYSLDELEVFWQEAKRA
jgi:tetrapyrrole methylase family protein / MazG family protein